MTGVWRGTRAAVKWYNILISSVSPHIENAVTRQAVHAKSSRL